MKIAVFDPFSGISGNMVLGAILDCGADMNDLVTGLRSLPLDGWEIKTEPVSKSGLAATHAIVNVPQEKHHRHFSHIREIIASASLPDTVKEGSLKAFRNLAQAEAASHGIPVEKVHFHEVGAMDALIDVVGSFLGLHLLGVDHVYSSPVSTGRGTVTCAHGVMPLPAPATLRLLQGVPVVQTEEPFELTTPTGAAILTSAVCSWHAPPAFVPEVCGMGAGSRDITTRPNVLRLTIGSAVPGHIKSDSVVRMESIIDDLDPRIWPVMNAEILCAGALDCFARTCLGKKGRNAMELVVLCPVEKRGDVLESVFKHSSSLGIRISEVERVILQRDFRDVQTRYGAVPVKLGFYRDRVVSAEPEFDRLVEISERTGIPVKKLLQEVRGAAAALFSIDYHK